MDIDRQRWSALAREAAGFLPDVVRLFKDVGKDPRVPRGAKIRVGAALAYILSPIDLVPDWLPGIGALDDLAIVALAARELLDGAGEDVVREHWRGTDKGLDVLLKLVAADLRPRTLARRLVTEQLFGMGKSKPVRGNVIDGEIVDRAPTRRPR
jgi:uncharacterized membrane protein YkvA (DUF1232 family)